MSGETGTCRPRCRRTGPSASLSPASGRRFAGRRPCTHCKPLWPSPFGSLPRRAAASRSNVRWVDAGLICERARVPCRQSRASYQCGGFLRRADAVPEPRMTRRISLPNCLRRVRALARRLRADFAPAPQRSLHLLTTHCSLRADLQTLRASRSRLLTRAAPAFAGEVPGWGAQAEGAPKRWQRA